MTLLPPEMKWRASSTQHTMQPVPLRLSFPPHRFLTLLFCGLLSLDSSAFAELDIVAANKDGEEPVYVLKDTTTGKVFGTFWNREKDTSDYGFESSVVPDFLWSEDRKLVAVSGGAPRSRVISLYQVTKNSLKEITVPQLTDEQAATILAINDTSAEGTEAVRWQPDGTLLLRFWAASKAMKDNETPQAANVWAVLEINGGKAAITSTTLKDPSAQATADAHGCAGFG